MKELTRIPEGKNSLPSGFQKLIALAVADEQNPHTIKAYSRNIEGYFRWCIDTKQIQKPEELLSKATVLEYRKALQRGYNAKRKVYQPTSINLRIAAIKKLAKEAFAARIIDAQSLAALQGLKGVSAVYRKGQSQSLKARWLTLDELKKLCTSRPYKQTWMNKRLQALVTLLSLTGLRIAEAAGLKTSQVQQTHEDRWLLKDVLTKGMKLETFPLPEAVIEALRAGTCLGTTEEDQLLFGGWREQGMRKALSRAARKSGLGTITPHDLRRSFAKLAKESGASLDDISQALGHASTRTTMIYLGKPEGLKEAPGDRIKLV